MKTYITPALVAKGSVVALTHGPMIGNLDPDEVTYLPPAGSVGFGF
jgi:hypothetical protein